MQIANPIYDVVFKYLMSDSKIAKLLIGSIIGEEITALSFSPQEYSTTIERHSLTVYRLDFAATIKTEKGDKQVLIEIQKAKFATDIMRFRKYLGDHYANRENGSLPIISIYFLGYSLGIKAPLIKVKRHYYDVIEQYKEITEKIQFIESLTHDSYIVQIPHLSLRYKTDLEHLLSIFDQHSITSDHHILNVKVEAFPKKYQHIIRKLQQAIAEPQLRKTMDIEDEILEELQDKERLIARLQKEKDDALAEKDNALAEKNKSVVINAYQSGLDINTIKKITQLDSDEIQKIIEEYQA